jgi:hypothetical protein
MGERGTAAGGIGITLVYRRAYIEHIVTQRAQVKTLFHWNSDGMLPQCLARMRIKDLQRIGPLAGERQFFAQMRTTAEPLLRCQLLLPTAIEAG